MCFNHVIVDRVLDGVVRRSEAGTMTRMARPRTLEKGSILRRWASKCHVLRFLGKSEWENRSGHLGDKGDGSPLEINIMKGAA
jgi:hypothetical protein